MHKNSGFTIVELLIVIVVIGILATISIIAYGSIQDRARNTLAITSSDQWEKTIRSYHAVTGSFPKGNLDYVCLNSELPAGGPYAANQCLKAPTWGVSVDSAMIEDIKSTTGFNVPDTEIPSLDFKTGADVEHYRGLLYLSRNDGVGITYALKGDSSSCSGSDGFFEGDGFVACRRVISGDPYAGL